jgi:hypothetical protein
VAPTHRYATLCLEVARITSNRACSMRASSSQSRRTAVGGDDIEDTGTTLSQLERAADLRKVRDQEHRTDAADRLRRA